MKAVIQNLIPRVYRGDQVTIYYWLGYELVMENKR